MTPDMSSAYRALTRDETLDRLTSIKNPLILYHVRPDGDAVGSAAALACLFRALGAPAAIYSGDKIPERLSFLLPLSGAVPYDSAADYTAVSVDSASLSRLAAEGCPHAPVLMIDHHAAFTPYTDYYSVPEAAACGEILASLTSLLLSSGRLPSVSRELATLLYAAIASDTGGFRFQNTTPKTLEAVAWLLQNHADSELVTKQLFESKTMAELRAEALAIERLTREADGKIAVIALEGSDMTQDGLSPEDFETAVDIARSLAGVQIAVTVKGGKSDPHEYHVSLRSRGVNVASFAAAYGGGGHIRAAGFTVTAGDAKQALDSFLPALIALL